MKLTKTQIAKIAPNVANAKCQLCGTNKWTISEDVMILTAPAYKPNESTLGEGQFPVVVLTCDHCQQVIFLSAKRLGIVGDE